MLLLLVLVPRARAGSLATVVAADVLAQQGPTVSLEIELQPTDITGVLAGLYAQQPIAAVTWSADHYFAVWPGALPMVGSDRLAPDGTVLGVPRSDDFNIGNLEWVDVVHVGVYDFAFFSNEFDSHIEGMRYDALGNPVDAAPFVYLDGGTTFQDVLFPALATDGNQALLVYTSTTDTFALRIGSTGQPLDAIPTVLGAEYDQQLAVVGGSAGFLVAVKTPGAAIGTYLVGSNGQRIGGGPTTLPAPANPGRPAVAWNGQQYLVTFFSGYVGGSHATARATRLASDGTILDSPSILIDADVGLVPALHAQEIAAASLGSGGDFLLAWSREQPDSTWQLKTALLHSDGGVVPSAQGLPVIHPTALKVVAANGGYLVAWLDALTYPALQTNGLLGARVDSTGALLDGVPFPVVTGGDTQSIAQMGITSTGGPVAAWIDQHGLTTDLYARRVSPGGTLLDSAATHLFSTGGYATQISAASSPNDVLVLAQYATFDGGALWAHVIAPTGVESEQHLLTTNVNCCSTVAGDDAGFIATFIDLASNAVTLRLDVHGQPVAAPASLGMTEYAPHSALNGANQLVIWGDNSGRVMGRHVNSAGAFVEGASFLIASNTACPEITAEPGGFALVCWDALTPSEVQCARFSPTGARLDATPLTVGPDSNLCVMPFWFANAFQVTFQELDGGSEVVSIFADGGLTAAQPASFIAQSTCVETQSGSALLGSSRASSPPPGGQATVLLLGGLSDGQGCTDAGECASGVCQTVCCVGGGAEPCLPPVTDAGIMHNDGGSANDGGGTGSARRRGILLPDGGRHSVARWRRHSAP